MPSQTIRQQTRVAVTIMLALACAVSTVWPLRCAAAEESSRPHLRRHGTATQLIVDGKPFLVLGGELGNSAAASADVLAPIWERLVRLHLNTVLVPAYWDLIEPSEGQYDFTLVEAALKGAREHNLRVIFLWFGSWKNSMSCYAPAWVKVDQERFPRCRRPATVGGWRSFRRSAKRTQRPTRGRSRRSCADCGNSTTNTTLCSWCRSKTKSA